MTTPSPTLARVTYTALVVLAGLTLAFLPLTIFLSAHPTTNPVFLLYIIVVVPLAASFLCYATARHPERSSNV